MKKVLFLQLKSDSYGGVWFVNKTLGEKFVDLGYDVKLIGIRRNHPNISLGKTNIQFDTINKTDNWEIVHRRDVLNSIKQFKFFRTLFKYFKDYAILRKDYQTLKNRIRDYNPDYIIASHYGLLDGIPKEYLKRTVHVQHSSFEFALSDNKNKKYLAHYNNKVFRLLWLSKSICEHAIKKGFNNSIYIYNPIKFKIDQIANVVKNKKIVVVTRISPEKRINLMIKIVNKVLKDHKDWFFEIYGTGEFDVESKRIIETNSNISYRGRVDDAKSVFLNSSINLNTSEYEGFCLSNIEGLGCGVPVISYDNSESITEQIKDGYNGHIIDFNNEKQFIDKLNYLISHPDDLKKMSENSFEFSKKFSTETIINQWIELFNEME